MTHICVSKLSILGSDNGLSPGRRQAIIWTNAGKLLIGPLGTNFSKILIEILTFSFKKMRLKVSSAKRRPFCLGLNVLKCCLVHYNQTYEIFDGDLNFIYQLRDYSYIFVVHALMVSRYELNIPFCLLKSQRGFVWFPLCIFLPTKESYGRYKHRVCAYCSLLAIEAFPITRRTWA